MKTRTKWTISSSTSQKPLDIPADMIPLRKAISLTGPTFVPTNGNGQPQKLSSNTGPPRLRRAVTTVGSSRSPPLHSSTTSTVFDPVRKTVARSSIPPVSTAAKSETSLLLPKRPATNNYDPLSMRQYFSRNRKPGNGSSFHHDKERTPLTIKDAPKKAPRFKSTSPYATLENLSRSTVFVSETKQSFSKSNSEQQKRNQRANSYSNQYHHHTAGRSASWNSVCASQIPKPSSVRKVSGGISEVNSWTRERHESKKTNYESDKMKTSRSELSLLEQKKLQWAKEREELNGLWSPWGRQPPDSSNSPTSAAMQAQVSYPSPTNVVTSSYVANLGIGSGAYSPSCSESCYLPPINSTIAQQPRQKAKVWNNTDFQPEDYRYENDSGHNHHHPNRSALQARKASLPNYMFESGDGYHNGNNYHHQQMLLQQHGKMDEVHYNSNSNLRALSMDEDAFTSGYYSENNNNNNNGDEQTGQASKELLLKPTSRERSYQEEITVQKAVSLRGEHNVSPRVIVHKIYAQNGEVIAEQEDGREMIVNTMVMSNSSGRGDGNSRVGDYSNHNHHHYESSRSPCGNLPRNHAMRSSLTIGVDARTVDAYSEIDRREKEQWLIELEKQREEQRLRKLMEKEERRPRWGDRGIGVGHFWEPSDSENSHLPAPPQSSRVKGGGGCVGQGITISSPRGVEDGNGDGESYSTHHPGQSHTPPAWLEKGLTRMQSSKSQPCLHDPEFIHDLDRVYTGMEDTGGSNNNNISSSRSLNHSAIDLRNVVGYNSPTGDPQTDRTFTRGQNVPIDLDTYTEMEKKRLANQEHLEALKKQIEERQQKQKEEKERQLQEDREHEMRIARQRELELQRLEMEKRGKGPVNGDMPNCIEENSSTEHSKVDMSSDPKSSKISAMLERSNISIHDSDEQKDIEIVQRQSVMVVTATTPSTDLGEEEGKTTNTEGSDSSKSNLRHHHHQHRLSRQDQSVMTDLSDTMYERTLTPSMQRSRSLSVCRSSREFGTQTELSDGSSSTSSSSGSLRGSGKNNDMTRSHNSLLDKKKGKDKVKQEKKAEERPRWGSNPVKKQYVKQSEKDPNYISRMKRRQDRLKRMEDERSVRGDTGTESEDVSIPFHRIRQRRSEPSPQRRTRGIAPMKATHLTKTDKDEMILKSCSSSLQQEESLDEDRGRRDPPPPRSMRAPHDVPYPHSNMKNSKSETQLNKKKTAEMLDRNFGSIAGVNVSGTSEESSGFSTPFLARRELGSGSTGSGTTGSGSGVQSPDLAYHTYQASKSTREEQNFARITSGRDSHAPVTTSRTHISSGNKVNTSITSSEFSCTQKGFIHQREFDEIPIKPSRSTSFKEEEVAKPNVNSTNSMGPESAENPVVSRSRKPSGFASKPRNKSMSPKRKTSPVKVKKSGDEKSKREMGTIVNDNKRRMSVHDDNLNLPEIPQSPRLTSPPVPALFKKLQMGLQPDESGRISSLPTEFPDILTPLPTIPIGSLMSPNPSRLSSAASSAGSRIDIDIAVTPRGNPEIMKLFEAAEERIKQRQLNAILQSNNGGAQDSDSARSRTSFEADVGSISINLEPVMLYPSRDPNGVEKTEIEIPTSARLSIRSHPLGESSRRPPPVSARDDDLAAKHGAFIASILNRKEVKEQLSARESELSEKGIIEFSIRLPSTSASGDADQVDEYRDPLLTERRRHTAQWLYGGQSVPQKQAILTNLASLKKGIAMQQQEWKVGNSDTE